MAVTTRKLVIRRRTTSAAAANRWSSALRDSCLLCGIIQRPTTDPVAAAISSKTTAIIKKEKNRNLQGGNLESLLESRKGRHCWPRGPKGVKGGGEGPLCFRMSVRVDCTALHVMLCYVYNNNNTAQTSVRLTAVGHCVPIVGR